MTEQSKLNNKRPPSSSKKAEATHINVTKFGIWLTTALAIAILALPFAHLVFAPLTQPIEIGQGQAIIVVILLLIHSGFLQRIASISLDSKGITIQNIKATQQDQQQQLLIQQKELSEAQLQLKDQQERLDRQQHLHEILIRHTAKATLTKAELLHLEGLYRADEMKNAHKVICRPEMVDELQHLGSLGFVGIPQIGMNDEDWGIWKFKTILQRGQEDHQKWQEADLSTIFKITDSGKQYLRLVHWANSDTPSSLPDF